MQYYIKGIVIFVVIIILIQTCNKCSFWLFDVIPLVVGLFIYRQYYIITTLTTEVNGNKTNNGMYSVKTRYRFLKSILMCMLFQNHVPSGGFFHLKICKHNHLSLYRNYHSHVQQVSNDKMMKKKLMMIPSIEN